MSLIRKKYYLTGRVQGVGFRYRALYAAETYGVTGWVHNEWDGAVVMELQGEPEAVAQVMKNIQQNRFVDIEGMEVLKIPVDEDERGFHIR